MIPRRTLGRTSLEAGRLGVAASYGVPAAAVEEAFERGVNYLYWGSRRTAEFGRALRNLADRRERMILVLQSYSRVGSLISWSVERALRAAATDYADIVLLGMWNKPVPPRILDACRRLRERGLVRHLAVSTHRRPLAPQLARDPDIGVVHVRYNAVHRGAESEVFPHLSAGGAGIVSFTATSWGQLTRRRRIPAGERVPTAGDCYRFVLAQPSVDVCLSGPGSLAQMREALDAAERGPLGPDEIAWMRRVGDAIYGKPRRA